MRVEETLFFESGTVEVRSRPLWVVIIETWFVWVHELISHKLKISIPYDDPYWGEPLEAGFHEFFTWTLNHDLTIDKTAHFTDLDERPRKPR